MTAPVIHHQESSQSSPLGFVDLDDPGTHRVCFVMPLDCVAIKNTATLPAAIAPITSSGETCFTIDVTILTQKSSSCEISSYLWYSYLGAGFV